MTSRLMLPLAEVWIITNYYSIRLVGALVEVGFSGGIRSTILGGYTDT